MAPLRAVGKRPLSLDFFRSAVLGFLLCGAVLFPLIAELALRQQAGPHWAQSEVLVIEQAASAVVHGHSPYGRLFSADLLGVRSNSNSHFPYLPAMSLFGVPHALLPSPATDSRVIFTLISVGCVVRALAVSRWQSHHKIRIVQMLFAVPPGALATATGGDDMPVLALLLLGLVLRAEGRPGGGRIAILVASLTKATAWPVMLALCMMRPVTQSDAAWLRRRLLASTAILALAAVAAPSKLLYDAVLFPLGLTADRSPADMTTPGGLLVRAIAGPALTAPARAIGLALLLAVLVLWLGMLWRRPPPDLPAALGAAAVLFLLLTFANPVGRPGYLAYPMNILCWRWTLGSTDRTRQAERPVKEALPW